MKTELAKLVFCFVLAFVCSVRLAAGEGAKAGANSADAAAGPASCPLPKDSPGASVDEPIAMVAGQPIYERDLADAIAAQMLQIRQQEYQIKDKALNELIRTKVVEAEAQKRGLTVDKLYEQEVDSKISQPSDAEVEGYYLAVKSQLNQPFQQVKPQLQNAIKVLKAQQARDEYADSLRAKTEVAVLLQPPKVDVSYDPARVRGSAKAPVTIVEFSDFQCPFCERTEATLKDLLTKYNGQVKLAFRDFPLRPIHPRAEAAAEAGRCALEQGKFWEYHDALFADQTKLDEAGLIATAQKLGLEGKTFQSCLASGKYKPQIDQDEKDGQKAGVNGTPGFFIDGVFLNGAQPKAEFERIIESELALLKNKSARASR